MIDPNDYPMTDGWIVPSPLRSLTPNRYKIGVHDKQIMPIECVVYHYTAGTFEGSRSWLTNPNAKASAHFLISKDGLVVQLAPLTERTWHAGGATSKWRDKGQVNNRSIGIEIANWGPLKAQKWAGGEKFLISTGREFKGQIFKAPDGSAWEAYPEAQIAAVEMLTRRLVKLFPALRNKAGVVEGPPNGTLIGHQHVDPSRKSDPGHAFPWARILAAANGV